MNNKLTSDDFYDRIDKAAYLAMPFFNTFKCGWFKHKSTREDVADIITRLVDNVLEEWYTTEETHWTETGYLCARVTPEESEKCGFSLDIYLSLS